MEFVDTRYGKVLSYLESFDWSRNGPIELEADNVFWLDVLRNFSRTSFDELAEQVHIEGTASLQEAEIVIFGEMHNLRESQLLNWQLINRLAQPGDVVLYESNDKMLNLNETMIRIADLSFSEKRWANDALNLEQLKSVGALPLQDLFAFGWDQHAAVRSDTTVSFTELFVAPIDVANSIFNGVSDEGLSARNSVLAKIIEKLPYKRVFVVAGQFHLPTAANKLNPRINKSFATFDRALADRPYALVWPKMLDDFDKQVKNDWETFFKNMGSTGYYGFYWITLFRGSNTHFSVLCLLELVWSAKQDIEPMLSHYTQNIWLVGAVTTRILLSAIALELRCLYESCPEGRGFSRAAALFGSAIAIGGIFMSRWSSQSAKIAEMRSQEPDLTHLDFLCPKGETLSH